MFLVWISLLCMIKTDSLWRFMIWQTGAVNPALLSPLGSYVIEWFRNSREVLFYDSEAPSGADTCAYLASTRIRLGSILATLWLGFMSNRSARQFFG